VAANDNERGRYQKDVSTLDPHHPWFTLRDAVPAGSRVLDVGCGSGDLGRFLATCTTEVDGVEPDPSRAQEARRHLHMVVTGLAGPSVDDQLTGAYDVIVFADVLEHIASPDASLQWAASRLAPSGRVIGLIPNSANWKVRRKILKGDWSYADTGYFDRDHLRFYDVNTARLLGEAGGLRERSVRFVPGELPKPFRSWNAAAARATALRPNLFAGHILVVWERCQPSERIASTEDR
jgi:SAM-dependent methyltransferase